MSALSATSSVMAVEGVSGEIATPAFMLRAWIVSMRDRGSAERSLSSWGFWGIKKLQYWLLRDGNSIVHHPHLRCRQPTGYCGAASVGSLGIAGLACLTFSGWATIIWQSMNIPGTPLDTHERIGAPTRSSSMRFVHRSEWHEGRSHPS